MLIQFNKYKFWINFYVHFYFMLCLFFFNNLFFANTNFINIYNFNFLIFRENYVISMLFQIISQNLLEYFVLLNIIFILIVKTKPFFKLDLFTLKVNKRHELYFFENTLIILFILFIIHIILIKYNIYLIDLFIEKNKLYFSYQDSLFHFSNKEYFLFNFSTQFFKTLLIFFFIFIFFLYSYDIWIFTEVENSKKNFILFILLNFLIFFSSCFLICYDFFLLFILLIGLNLNIYALIVFDNRTKTLNEATIKYFITSTVGTLFILGGISLIFLFYKTTNFFLIHNIILYNKTANLFEKLKEFNNVIIMITDIYHEVNINKPFDYNYLLKYTKRLNNFFWNYNNMLIILFILIGLTFKLALFPLHSWSVEIYSTFNIRLIAIFVLILKLIFFVKTIQILFFVFQFHNQTIKYLKDIIKFIAISSIIFGSIAALFEDKIRKIIAYSSINQFGFIFLGISTMLNDKQDKFFWTTIEGLQSSIFFIIIYLFSNLFLFFYVNEVRRNAQKLYKELNHEEKDLPELTYIEDIKLLSFKTQIYIFIILFSFSGLPPFAGFFSKFFILSISWNEELYLITILAVMSSLFSNFYYLKIIKINIFDRKKVQFKHVYGAGFKYIWLMSRLVSLDNTWIYKPIKSITPKELFKRLIFDYNFLGDRWLALIKLNAFFFIIFIVFFFFFLDFLLEYSLILAINMIYFL